MNGLFLSIVIPIFNEQSNITKLFNELKEALNFLLCRYEIIYINDGSTDNSNTIIKEICKNDFVCNVDNI